MKTDRVNVIGIRPMADSIGPPGLHLRWMFTPRMGFPGKGFEVFRREKKKGEWDIICSYFAEDLLPKTFLNGMIIVFDERASLQSNPDGGLTVNNPSATPMQIYFEKPVARVEVRLRNIESQVTVSAFDCDQLIAVSTAGSSNDQEQSVAIFIEASYITHIEFQLNFNELQSICSQTVEAVCNEDWGEPIAKLPLLESPVDVEDALSRLESGLRNRFAGRTDEAKERYRGELPDLIGWLQKLQNPDSAHFVDPGAAPDELKLKSGEKETPLKEINPQSILLLAAMDPNIARFLSLYWVDTQNTKKNKKSYDYKIVGQWIEYETGEVIKRCALFFDIRADEADLPQVAGPVGGRQLSGLSWHNRQPLGRIGIRWERVPDLSEPPKATKPILFDVSRRVAASDRLPGTRIGSISIMGRKKEHPFELLTADAPVFVSEQSWDEDKAPFFIDTDLPIDTYSYTVNPIDVFGQVGQAVESASIAVKDLEAPPPPVRVRSSIIQEGYPWRTPDDRKKIKQPANLVLYFEYGDFQHQQAPDAEWFQLYWKPDSLFKTVSATVSIVSRQYTNADQNVYVVRVQTNEPSGCLARLGIAGHSQNLKRFENGVLTNVFPEKGTLPIGQRRRCRIDKVIGDDLLQLAPTKLALQDGQYRLVSDPHCRENWEPLNKVQVKRPVKGKILNKVSEDHGFSANVMAVFSRLQRTDPLSMLPIGRRTEENLTVTDTIELLIDKALLEPDLFNGGIVEIEGRKIDILYSTAGIAYKEDERKNRIRTTRVGISNFPLEMEIIPGQIMPIPPLAVTLRGITPFNADVLRSKTEANQTHILVANPLPFSIASHLVGSILSVGDDVFPVTDAQSDGDVLHLTVRTAKKITASNAILTPPQIRYLEIKTEDNQGVEDTPGGELAFDKTSNGNGGSVTHLARVVSASEYVDGTTKFLVRFSGALPLDLDHIKANKVPCRYYSPYALSLQLSLTVNNPSDIMLPISPKEASRKSYFAISTIDLLNKEGPLSAPAQITAVRPPPTGKPGRPFPCGVGPETVEGYATSPDQQGRATVCLEWDAGTLETSESLRFEVARALDNTIIATDRRNWLLGNEVEDPVPFPRLVVNGQIVSVNFAENAKIFKVGVTVPLNGLDVTRLNGARLNQIQENVCFKINRAFIGQNSNYLDLLVSPLFPDTTPHQGACEIQEPPDYSSIRDDNYKLQQLAEKLTNDQRLGNEDAFGLVTGMPISGQKFTDEIPGIGENRFFYRVRAVDGAENRSDYSEVSVPFYQVDTSPPDAPLLLVGTGGERKASIQWVLDSDTRVAEYRLYRSAQETELDNVRYVEPVAVIGRGQLPSDGGLITYVDKQLDALPSGRCYHYCLVAVRRVPQGSGPSKYIEVPSPPSNTVSVEVIDTRLPIPPQALALVRETSEDGYRIRIVWAMQDRVSFLVRRREASSSVFLACTDWIDGGNFSQAENRWEYEHVDRKNLEGETRYVYQIKVRNWSGRIALSPESDEV